MQGLVLQDMHVHAILIIQEEASLAYSDNDHDDDTFQSPGHGGT